MTRKEMIAADKICSDQLFLRESASAFHPPWRYPSHEELLCELYHNAQQTAAPYSKTTDVRMAPARSLRIATPISSPAWPCTAHSAQARLSVGLLP